ncbi:MAG: hypothetical protein KJ626_01940 [Verrucomicrobia bacterium]|nr:hypothetical protein [Verrucomicrobiota bacterium]
MKSAFFTRQVRTLALAVTMIFVAGAALAFPTWMGVYGSYERHAGSNPGTFTILMNQDYAGLHADVGVQVNGGEWNTHQMSWVGNIDGNSQWEFTPASPFPAGSTVTYYFHGYDDWDGSIYDSDNANNYSFTVSGGGSSLSWGSPRLIPTAAQPQNVELAGDGTDLYAVWNEGDWQGNEIFFSKKAAGADWQTKISIDTDLYPHIAASSTGIHVIYGGYTTATYIRSTDDGASWSSPIEFTGANYPARYAKLRADDTYIYLVYNDYTPPDSDNIYFRRMHKDATAWEDPVQIFTHSSYKSTIYIKDFEVRGNNLYLTAYGQGWYGGLSAPYYYESTDGGTTWTEYAPSGDNVGQLDADAGNAYRAGYHSGPDGGGVYFQSKTAGGAWSSWNNVWPGDGWLTADGISKTSAGLATISLRNGLRYYRLSEDGGATWGSPALIDSTGYWCLQDLTEADNVHLLVQNQSQDGGGAVYTISTEASTPTPLEWAGSTYHWPLNGDLDSTDDLWINVESYPMGAGVSASVVYSTDGIDWNQVEMTANGQIGANDAWHVNLGLFPAGSDIQYAVVVRDGLAIDFWDNNSGQDYLAEVSGGSTHYQPIFWALDPYRFDNEKVRANGLASDASSHGFGEFQSGQTVTIVARPVENGNGDLVQEGSVTMESILHYTLTGDYSDVVSVTGTFHTAYFSSKPHFDYFSYDLGSFSADQTVTFWLDACNSEGCGYAQNAYEDFWFTVAAGADDSDGDGLLDQWEMNYFTNSLNQGAEDNPDNDGPTGRPIDNIIEQAIGLNPTVPNDPMGIRLLWFPSYPVQGGQVTLSYFYVNEGNPLFGKPVYAHVGHDGWQDVYDTAQLQLNGQISRFETTINVPADATELNVVFYDNAGTWDNNNGNDWTIPVKAAVGDGAEEVPAADIVGNKEMVTSTESADTSFVFVPQETTGEAVATKAPVQNETGNPVGSRSATRITTLRNAPAGTCVTVKLKGESDKEKMFLSIGHSGWKGLRDVPMTKTVRGVFLGSYEMPADVKEVNFSFRDADGNWDLNAGEGWTFYLAGNGNHKLVIDR